jgi:hypothetical protein
VATARGCNEAALLAQFAAESAARTTRCARCKQRAAASSRREARRGLLERGANATGNTGGRGIVDE